jgi:hypothetical protein
MWDAPPFCQSGMQKRIVCRRCGRSCDRPRLGLVRK